MKLSLITVTILLPLLLILFFLFNIYLYIYNLTSCAFMRELSQSRSGENRDGTLL